MTSALLYPINHSANMLASEFKTKAKLQLLGYKTQTAEKKKEAT